MGWAYGVNNERREVGYSVEATCDQDGCEKAIHRGLAYACGAMHDGGERGCGGYFCSEHIAYVTLREEPFEMSEQVCPACSARIEAEVAKIARKRAEHRQKRALFGPKEPQHGQNRPQNADSMSFSSESTATKNVPMSGNPA